MTQTIEQLTARVRELEEENARLNSEIEMLKSGKRSNIRLGMELASSQAYAEQLREALNAWIGIASNCSIESGCCCCGESMENHSSPMMCGHSPVDMADSVVRSAIQKTDEALALPHDTSALDAYVAEKVKEATAGHVEDIRFKGKEIEELRRIRMARFNNEDCWIFQGDGEDHLESLSCPVVVYPHVLMTLTRQRDLAVEALEHIARSLPQIGVERVWMMDHANKVLSTIKESEAMAQGEKP